MGQLKIIPFHSIGNCLVLGNFSADNYNFYGAASRLTSHRLQGESERAEDKEGTEKENENIPTRFAVNQVERLNNFSLRSRPLYD